MNSWLRAQGSLDTGRTMRARQLRQTHVAGCSRRRAEVEGLILACHRHWRSLLGDIFELCTRSSAHDQLIVVRRAGETPKGRLDTTPGLVMADDGPAFTLVLST